MKPDIFIHIKIFPRQSPTKKQKNKANRYVYQDVKRVYNTNNYINFAFGLLKGCRLKKIRNYLSLKFRYGQLKSKGDTDNIPFPIALSIEPTTACNLGCSQCPSGLKSFSRPTGNVDLDNAKVWIDNLKDYLFYINFYFQGEPLIHPKLPELIAHAHSYGISSAISTNAHFLTPQKCELLVQSGLSKIIVSLDGLTQASYEQYREGGSLEKVTEGLKNLNAAKKKFGARHPLIEVQFIVFKQNEHEIPELSRFVKKLGVDVLSLKTAQIYDQQSAEKLLPKNPKYLRYSKSENGDFELKNKFKNECWRMWSSSVITQNGDVVPCCFDKDAEHTMGNINEESYADIMNGDKYKSFIKTVFTNRKSIDICRNCSEGSKIY